MLTSRFRQIGVSSVRQYERLIINFFTLIIIMTEFSTSVTAFRDELVYRAHTHDL